MNYLFFASAADESNVVRISARGELRVEWSLSGSSEAKDLRGLYRELTGYDEAAISKTPLVCTLTVRHDGYSESTEGRSYEQSGEWSWSVPETGLEEAVFEFAFNVEELLAFDRAAGAALESGFGMPLSKKRIRVQLMSADTEDFLLSEPEESGLELESTLRLPVELESGRSGWTAINLWEDGEFLAPERIHIQLLEQRDGLRSERLSWSYDPEKRYQLQVVDLLGRSRSVFFDKSAEHSQEVLP